MNVWDPGVKTSKRRAWALSSKLASSLAAKLPSSLSDRALSGIASGAKQVADWAQDAQRVANFLRESQRFEPRADDIWIATYPRSGTTWSQYILLLLVHGVDFEFEHVHDVSPWFERSLALGSHRAETLAQLEAPRIFKTHLPGGWVPKKGRILHISRDGRDVALSYFNLYQKYLGFEGSFDEFFERFLTGELQYRSWFDFEEGWKARHGEPSVLALNYEDMREDPEQAVANIASHLGLERSPAEIHAVAEAVEISKMKDIEHKFDHAQLLLRERGVVAQSFIRSGRVGHGAKGLTPDQEKAFGEAKRRSEDRKSHREYRIDAFLH